MIGILAMVGAVAVAGPLDARCATAAASPALVMGQYEYSAQAASGATYGSKTCPGAFIADFLPRQEYAVDSVQVEFGGTWKMPPRDYVECNRLVLAVRIFGIANGVTAQLVDKPRVTATWYGEGTWNIPPHTCIGEFR